MLEISSCSWVTLLYVRLSPAFTPASQIINPTLSVSACLAFQFPVLFLYFYDMMLNAKNQKDILITIMINLANEEVTAEFSTSLPCGGSLVNLIEDCRKLMGNLGCPSVVTQNLKLSWMLSVVVTVSKPSSRKSNPRWQFCRSNQPPSDMLWARSLLACTSCPCPMEIGLQGTPCKTTRKLLSNIWILKVIKPSHQAILYFKWNKWHCKLIWRWHQSVQIGWLGQQSNTQIFDIRMPQLTNQNEAF